MKDEIYIVVDIEADGPIPGPHSMLSLAAVACRAEGEMLGEFTANLETLPGATADPVTTAWWAGFPEAWRAARVNSRAPTLVINEFQDWVNAFPGKPVFVGYPAGFDFMFVQWYLLRLTGRTPFRHAALDIKTLAMVHLHSDYRNAVKSRLPPQWTAGLPHTHVALDDAREQCALFVQLMRALQVPRP